MIEQPPIRLLHVITDLNIGGAEISLYRLLTCLDRTKYASQVVSLTPAGELGDKIRELGIPVFSLNMKPGQPSLNALRVLSLRMRNERFDIVQSWLYHADLLGLMAARAANIEHVVWNIRNSYLNMSDYRRLSRVVLKGCGLLSGWPQAVVCNSRAGQAFHIGLGYHPRRWVIIPNGFDPDEFKPNHQARLEVRQELGLASDILLVGMTARFDPVKGHVDFLKAAGALVRSGVDAHFVMIGHGVTFENEILSSIITQENLGGRVHLLGQREDLPRLYASLDMFSLASYGEGFPNVAAEAMLCGVPCAVTDVGDAKLIVGGTGRVVPPRDSTALANAWNSLLSLSDFDRQSLGARARQRIIECYSLEKMVSAYDQLYRDIMAGSGVK